jgi:Flp pilus assembly protein TadG
MTVPARRWWRLDDKGTTAIEFAMIVPLLFFFFFAMIESYFVLLNFQQIQAVASETARCVALNSSLCASGGQAYAVQQSAPGHAVGGLTSAMVTVNSSTTCGSATNMTKIIITYPVAKALPVNFIPSFMANFNVVGVGCFPN